MTTSNEKFLILNCLPAYTVEQWADTYKRFVDTYYSTPLDQRKSLMFKGFINDMKKVQIFLNTKGFLFI